MKILKWQEIVGKPGFYWMFNLDGSEGTLIEVGYRDHDTISFVGLEQEELLCGDVHGKYHFVKQEMPDIKGQLVIDVFAQQRQFQHSNGDSYFPPMIEGYWRQHDVIPTYTGEKCNMKNYIARANAECPWPVVWNIPEFDKQEFINRLADIEDEKAAETRYRGMSICRLTGADRGCNEYEYRGWKWPGGFIEYVRLGVPPSRAFYAFIMGVSEEDCKYLPTYNRDMISNESGSLGGK
uniref:Uncharacterized protein n=1 Tax=Pseudomonas phage HRDY3 TaxID=3236930 RepID=A0AB39CDW7_9VIRU